MVKAEMMAMLIMADGGDGYNRIDADSENGKAK